MWVLSPRLPLINILFDCFVTSGTKIHTALHSYMYASRTPRKNHATKCISAGRCGHKVKTPDRIFHQYIVLFKTFEFFCLVFFLWYIFLISTKMPHGQLHIFNVCLLLIYRIKLSSTLNISRLSQQTPPLFFLAIVLTRLYWFQLRYK